MKIRIFSFYIIFFIIFLSVSSLYAQNVDSLARVGEAAHRCYDFDLAVDAFSAALDILESASADSPSAPVDSLALLAMREKVLQAENGKNMRRFSYVPAVVAKHRFSLEDFFLYYPLPDKSWRNKSNLTGASSFHPFSKALYAPSGAECIYYSAVDNEGISNIYKTELEDSLWSVPNFLNEQVLSPSDEIYPMLSPDGKTLYFASEGLYGVGGYDIYMSEWSDENNDWSTPVNMGFPYSSPADDFLFINTDDGRYTLFASNRDCSVDSVYVYVLEHESVPVRKEIYAPEQLCSLARLDVSEVSLEESEISSKAPEDESVIKYMDKMGIVRAMKDSVTYYISSLDDDRNRFALSNDVSERTHLTHMILKHESKILELQDSLNQEIAELQKIEMDLLFNGITIDPEEIIAEMDRETVGDATNYVFKKMNMGNPLMLDVKEPEKRFDYSFKVLPVGQFAEDNTIPDGIVYQIQIFSTRSKATVKNLRGLSPVFEKKYPTGAYVYRVGLFSTYNDVLSKLNTVKKAGFRQAFIVAYIDGEEVKVAKARSKEVAPPENEFYQVILVPGEGGLDSALADGIRQQASGKDLARSEDSEGRTIYMIGAFSDRKEADALADFIKAMGLNEVSVEILEMK